MGKLLFLKKDYDGLEANIKKVRKLLEDVIDDKRQSESESSETWHDNFGHEEGVRQERMLTVQLNELVEMKHKSEIVAGIPPKNKIGIGSEVVLREEGSGKEISVLVGSYHVFDKISPNEVSYVSPIIKPFMGAKAGVKREVARGGNKSVFEVISIK